MANYEMTIRIEEVGDELELAGPAEVVTGGMLPPGQADQQTRRGVAGHKNNVKKEKKDRHNGNHRHPDVIGPHLPLFLVNHAGPHNDTIIFECAQNFVVDVSLDDGFDPPAGANAGPQNPFGWLLPQQGGPGNPVRGTINKGAFPGGANRVDFFKCTVWCNGKKLDPDIICEAGP